MNKFGWGKCLSLQFLNRQIQCLINYTNFIVVLLIILLLIITEWRNILLNQNTSAPHMVLQLPQDHDDSDYVLSFEIGQRKGGFYSTRTDGQTHPVPY